MSPPDRPEREHPTTLPATPATSGAYDARTVARSRWALLGGNFAIACGVMAPSGVMNDLVDSLQVTAAVAGQLITIGAVVLAVSAPLLAAWVAGSDRRRLLTLWLLWFALGHALAALAPNFAVLAIVRTVTLLGAAVFTPQAGAAIALMTPPESRGHAITFVFLGWAVASVLGLPMHAYVAETFGWRFALAGVAGMAALAAWWIWRVMPDGVRPAQLSGAQWRSVFTDPVLMAVVLVTAMAGAAQFTLFSYMAPYFRQVLAATPAQIAGLFLLFGVAGLASSVIVTRVIDRFGTPRMVALLFVGMATSFALWPLAGTVATMALVLLPWSIGCFAAQSAQHARLTSLAPALAPASMALNSAAIYVGQAVGAATGGAMLAVSGFTRLSWAALAWMVVAIGLSQWAAARQPKRAAGNVKAAA
ncbi:MAG TPA: MFS transporter [Burkholderiaceae bacterium]|nr:MFS transporter [Burkholderiaceae bacterium]